MRRRNWVKFTQAIDFRFGCRMKIASKLIEVLLFGFPFSILDNHPPMPFIDRFSLRRAGEEPETG